MAVVASNSIFLTEAGTVVEFEFESVKENAHAVTLRSKV